MKKTVQLVLGTFALCSSVAAFAPSAFAGAFSSVVGPWGSTTFSYGPIIGQVSNTLTSARLQSHSSSILRYQAFLYVNCQNQPLATMGGSQRAGVSNTLVYNCSSIVNSQGYLDN